MTDHPLVALVTPVHNSRQYTEEFLRSLRKLTYPNWKAIIIDDGSADGTAQMLEDQFPEVLALKADGTLWSTRAINWGIEKALEIGADYILLVDNDTVLDAEFVSALVRTAEENPRSIVTGKIYFYDRPQVIQQAGAHLSWVRPGFHNVGWGEPDRGQYDQPRDLNCATLGVLVKAEYFRDLGLMDAENFPMYKADTDFGYRAYRKGYRIIYEPRAKLWHRHSATAKKKLIRPLAGKSFVKNPFAAFSYAASDRSRGTGMSLREFTRFWLRHFPLQFPYIALVYALRRVARDLVALVRGFHRLEREAT